MFRKTIKNLPSLDRISNISKGKSYSTSFSNATKPKIISLPVKAIVGSSLFIGSGLLFNYYEKEKRTVLNKSAEKFPGFIVTQKKDSLYYELNDPKELKAVEVDKDLDKARFFYSFKDGDEPNEIREDNEQNYEWIEERRRIKGVVKSAVYPTVPEMGYNSTYNEYVEISGSMINIMPECSKNVIKNYCISEQLHTLEWILTKARNSGILPHELYERIRIDVRHRAKELQEVAKINHDAYQQLLKEIEEKYSPPANFKRIKTLSDLDEFAGQIVAFLGISFLFVWEVDKAVILPISGQKIRFAKIGEYSISRGEEQGYNVGSFLNSETRGDSSYLSNSKISEDPILAMRSATSEELAFLKSAVELDQVRLSYKDKKSDINLLAREIARAAIETDIVTEGLRPILPFSFFTKRSASTPPIASFKNGIVDWTRANENQDKSEPPKPSRVYLIQGGSKESRENKAHRLASECLTMYATYHNKDNSECAVVMSGSHDMSNLMNFNLAKKLAGQQHIPDGSSREIIRTADFGIITINDELNFVHRVRP
jgi:hypothetical protein